MSRVVGWRFHPSEEELVNHFLKLKILGQDHLVDHIAEVNVNRFEPWQLPGQASSQVNTDEPVWYFLSAPECKYANSKRSNRTTKDGYWKPTGKERVVRSETTNEEIGTKGRVPNGVKTDWIMHEYKGFFDFPNQRDFLLYKLMDNSSSPLSTNDYNNNEEPQPSDMSREMSRVVGWRFHPLEEELVNHFLKLKMLGQDHLVDDIAEVNVNRFEPWQLPGQASSQVNTDEPVWYFLSAPECKYANSKRSNRTTKNGYWKPTGKERVVRSETTNEEIGTKKTLVFYTGRVPNGVKTDWIMHEYKGFFDFPNQRDFLLYKLMDNSSSLLSTNDYNNNEEPQPSVDQGGGGETSSAMSSNFYNPTSYEYDPNPVDLWEDSQLQAYLDDFRGYYNETSYNLNSVMQQQEQPWTSNTEENFTYDHSFYGYG
ncbi:NAC domain-containing protein 69 [Linum perenne]